MSNLSDFLGGGGGLKPFNDLGTVTGTVNLDVSEFGSFRVKQGAGAITLNVTGKAADTAGYVELFFYPDPEQAVTISGADLVENGYESLAGKIISLGDLSLALNVSAAHPNAVDAKLNNDGTKLFILDSNTIFQFSLSKPDIISTASSDNVSFALTGGLTSARSFDFSSDGSNFYAIGASANIFQYGMSSPFEISLAVFVASESIAGDVDQESIEIIKGDTKIYISGDAGNRIIEYDFTIAGDISSLVYNGIDLSISSKSATPKSTLTSKSGKFLYFVDSSGKVFRYYFNVAFSLADAVYLDELAATGLNLNSIFETSNSSKIYVIDSSEVISEFSPLYDLGPLFQYQIIHTGTAATFSTLTADYTIEDAT